MGTGYILGGEQFLSKLSGNQRNNIYWTVVYLKDGVGMYLLGDSFRCLNEGDLIMIPPHVDFSFDSADLGDEYNVNISVSVLRFDKEWLNALLAVFPTLADTVLRVKELKNPFAVRGLKWMKISTLLDEMLSCRRELQPIRVIELLEYLSTDTDYVPLNDLQTCDPIDLSVKIDRINAEFDFIDKKLREFEKLESIYSVRTSVTNLFDLVQKKEKEVFDDIIKQFSVFFNDFDSTDIILESIDFKAIENEATSKSKETYVIEPERVITHTTDPDERIPAKYGTRTNEEQKLREWNIKK